MTYKYYLILENDCKPAYRNTYEFNSEFKFTSGYEPYYFTDEDNAICEAKSQMKKIKAKDYYLGEVKIEVYQADEYQIDDEYLENQKVIFTILKSEETKQELFNRVLNSFNDEDFIDELRGFDIVDSVENHKNNYGTCEDMAERDILEDAINYYFDEDCEIMCYLDALEYLAKYDNSLINSLQLASEMGLDLASLNSGILASLLLADNCKDFTRKFLDKLEEEGYFDYDLLIT